jgi:hypothetical protein
MLAPGFRLSNTGTTNAVDELRQRPGRQPAVWIALSVAIAIALAAGFAVTTVLEVSDTLPGDIFTTLTRDEPPREAGWLSHVHGPPTGAARGMQLALLGLLLGGVPAAMLSAALVAFGRKSRKPWSGGWANVFLAGFVFQLSSLGLTTLLLVLLLLFARDADAPAGEVLFYGGLLGVSVLCGAGGLWFWRELQLSVHDEPLRIAPFQHGG